MNYLTQKELKTTRIFLNKGYIIKRVENVISHKYIQKKIKNEISRLLKLKRKINLNYLHLYVSKEKLNDLRVNLINSVNKDKNFKFHYFNLAKSNLYTLINNELMMQKNINISIQLPNDDSSLLPIHSDVWSGDSPYEFNLWVPMVNCYKTKSMYILNPKDNQKFNKTIIKNKKLLSSASVYNKLKKKLKWLKVNTGEFMIFDQTLPHGNVVNLEKHTRVSLNCRFKSIFSPYGDKKIGEFFIPITPRASTKIGSKYKFPF